MQADARVWDRVRAELELPSWSTSWLDYRQIGRFQDSPTSADSHGRTSHSTVLPTIQAYLLGNNLFKWLNPLLLVCHLH